MQILVDLWRMFATCGDWRLRASWRIQKHHESGLYVLCAIYKDFSKV